MFEEAYRTATQVEISQWIRSHIAQSVNVGVDTIAGDASFESFGVDSARAIQLVMELQDWLRFPGEIPVELLFEAESIDESAANIFALLGDFVARNQS